jgi:hypothetical protein
MTRCITIVISLLLFVSFAHADESYDMTSCWSGDFTMLSSSKELVIYSFDLKGVSRKNDESDAFHNWSFHLIGTSKIESGKLFKFVLWKMAVSRRRYGFR